MKRLCKLNQFRNVFFFAADICFNRIGYCLDIGSDLGCHDFAQGPFGRIGAYNIAQGRLDFYNFKRIKILRGMLYHNSIFYQRGRMVEPLKRHCPISIFSLLLTIILTNIQDISIFVNAFHHDEHRRGGNGELATASNFLAVLFFYKRRAIPPEFAAFVIEHLPRMRA